MIGNIGGVLTPIIVGAIRDATQSFTGGFLVTAAMLALGAGATFTLRSHFKQVGILRFGLQPVEE